MEKQRRRKIIRNVIVGLLGICMVIGGTVMGTLAYLYTLSNEETNTFTATNDISLFLDEPNYNLKNNAVKWPEQLDPRQYVPGETYLKDPTLYNVTGEQTLKDGSNGKEYAKIWVAMRVDYKIESTVVTYEQLTTNDKASGYTANKGGLVEEIDFDDDQGEGWIKLTPAMCSDISSLSTGAEIYVYKYPLKAKAGITKTKLEGETVDNMVKYQNETAASVTSALTEKTSPLFSQIQIKTLDQLANNGYEPKDLVPFEIKLKGAAIKDMVTINLSEITEAGLNATGDDTPSAEQKLVAELVPLLINTNGS